MLSTHSLPGAAGAEAPIRPLRGPSPIPPQHDAPARRDELSHASTLDALALFLDVLLPMIAKGVIVRRPAMLRIAERLDLDRRAVRRMQRLRARYGTAPLMLPLPVRNQAVILDPADVHRVLQQTPDPFSTASSEKRAALAHFEPKGALISEGADRQVRRRFNEDVLGHTRPAHAMAADFIGVVEDEAAQLLRVAQQRGGRFGWSDFERCWTRLVRRIVFGDGARDDRQLSDLMTRLRQHANWAFLVPQRPQLRERLHQRIRLHLQRADSGSLAAAIARMSPPDRVAVEQQIPQWLFAFDPAGMTAARTLALLAAHPQAQQAARNEATQRRRSELPYLRACALEALRLWPTTPLVLRRTSRDVDWGDAVLPAGSGVLIFAPFFHRDDETLPYADRLTPELWLGERTLADWPLIPFSEGSGVCPGRHLVLLVVSAFVAAVIDAGRLQLEPPGRLDERRPLPGTLNHFTLAFRLDA
ncbi:MAG TPA: cytochrome P450 [Burkholderiaceae bacterium]|nr:cytochrome P450 [Burkholderiaceae bacterium]